MMSEISLTMQFRKYEIHPSITQGSCIRDSIRINNILICLFYMSQYFLCYILAFTLIFKKFGIVPSLCLCLELLTLRTVFAAVSFLQMVVKSFKTDKLFLIKFQHFQFSK